MLFFTSIDVVYHICKLFRKIPVGRLNHVYCIIVNATCSFTFFSNFHFQRWVMWFGENTYSQVEVDRLKTLSDGLRTLDDKSRKKKYRYRYDIFIIFLKTIDNGFKARQTYVLCVIAPNA